MFLDTVNHPPHHITTAAEAEDGGPSQAPEHPGFLDSALDHDGGRAHPGQEYG